MNEFELLEKQINNGLEEGEIIFSGIIFFAGSKGLRISESVHYNFRTRTPMQNCSFMPPKKSDEEKERGIFAVPKGASSWPPPSSRRRSPVSQARTSVRALKHRICKG